MLRTASTVVAMVHKRASDLLLLFVVLVRLCGCDVTVVGACVSAGSCVCVLAVLCVSADVLSLPSSFGVCRFSIYRTRTGLRVC
jgi:hypothetical protein